MLNTSIYDGAKYEKNLNAISWFGIIGAAFDAMRSDRVYRKGMDDDAIREELINGSGTQFDPEYLTVFLSLFNEGEL
ncbi:MAG: hypothetical protein J5441_00085 [Clostridia bacterium]|nr:hypothetical protein [Clostridia bacterium]